jgi:hypothetical protein
MTRSLAGLLLVLVAAPLPAQAPADSLMQLLQQARTQRWIVRVTAESVVAHQGVVTQVSDSSFTVAGQRVPLARITMLERKMSSRRSLRTGAIVGGLLGGGLGALGAAFACSMDESGDGCSEVVILGIALVAGIGAGIGGLSAGFLGSSEWRIVWQK